MPTLKIELNKNVPKNAADVSVFVEIQGSNSTISVPIDARKDVELVVPKRVLPVTVIGSWRSGTGAVLVAQSYDVTEYNHRYTEDTGPLSAVTIVDEESPPTPAVLELPAIPEVAAVEIDNEPVIVDLEAPTPVVTDEDTTNIKLSKRQKKNRHRGASENTGHEPPTPPRP